MANTSSAKKAIRVAKKNREYNYSRNKKVKEATKAVFSGEIKNEKAGRSAVSALQKQLDKAVKNGNISKNKANRIKSKSVSFTKAKVSSSK